MRNAGRALALVLTFLLLFGSSRATVAQVEQPDTKEPAAKPPQAMPTDSTVSWTEAPAETKDRVQKRLSRIVLGIPRPPAPYELAEDGATDEISAYTGLIKGTPRWAPLEAWAGREFHALPASEEGGEYRTMEILVALNGVRGLSLGLASKSDKPHLFDVPGALAIEQSTVGGVDTTRADLAPEERTTAEPITLLRVYVVGPRHEARLREEFGKAGGFPAFGPGQLSSDHPDMVRSIVAEFFGAKSDVEGLAKKIDVAGLRKLLEP